MVTNILKVFSLIYFLASCSGGGGGDSSSNLTNPTKLSEESVIKKGFTLSKKIEKPEFFKIISSLSGMKGSFSATTNLSFKEELKTCVGTTSLTIIFDEALRKSLVERTVTKISGSCGGDSPSVKFQTKKELRLDNFFNILKTNEVEILEGTFENRPGYLISLKGANFTANYMLGIKDKFFDYLVTETSYNQTDGYFNIITRVTPLKTSQFDGSLVEDTPETGDIIELSELGVISLIN